MFVVFNPHYLQPDPVTRKLIQIRNPDLGYLVDEIVSPKRLIIILRCKRFANILETAHTAFDPASPFRLSLTLSLDMLVPVTDLCSATVHDLLLPTTGGVGEWWPKKRWKSILQGVQEVVI